MKRQQFKRCVEKLVQEYERSKAKHPDFDSIERAWKAIQREHAEVKNEILRDVINEADLAGEMLHLSNVALQGYMFLMENETTYKDKIDKISDGYFGEFVLRDNLLSKKESKVMTNEWWDGVIEACKAIKDRKKIQINFTEDPKKWQDCDEMQDGSRLIFLLSCQYRAKPEPKLRALTPQEWLEAMMAGKKIENMRSFSLVGNEIEGLGGMWIKVGTDIKIYTSREMVDKTFSDGSPCGMEVTE